MHACRRTNSSPHTCSHTPRSCSSGAAMLPGIDLSLANTASRWEKAPYAAAVTSSVYVAGSCARPCGTAKLVHSLPPEEPWWHSSVGRASALAATPPTTTPSAPLVVLLASATVMLLRYCCTGYSASAQRFCAPVEAACCTWLPASYTAGAEAPLPFAPTIPAAGAQGCCCC